MLRLAHRIATMPVEFANIARGEEFDSLVNSVKLWIRSGNAPPTLIADNVADMYVNNPKEEWALDDFPCATTPWPFVFVEYNGTQFHSRFKQVGFVVCELTPEQKRSECESDELLAWRAIPFMQVDGRPLFCDGTLTWFANPDGTRSHCYVDPPSGYSRKPEDFLAFFHVLLFTLSLVNCKNIAKRDATESEGPNAKWLRRQKSPEIRYHVLDIDPMRQTLCGEGGLEQNGLKKALHICRGHFATYKEDGPGLFGRGQYGQFWIPQHKRGSKEFGEVVKDYRIKSMAHA